MAADGAKVGLPKIEAGGNGLAPGNVPEVGVWKELKGVAAGLSLAESPFSSVVFCGLPVVDREGIISLSDSPSTKSESLIAIEPVSTSDKSSTKPCDCA